MKAIRGHLIRLSENRHFGRFTSHKPFNINPKISGFCILGHLLSIENRVWGATVSDNWTGSVTGSDSGITGSDGKVMLKSSGVRDGGTFTFAITNVTHSGYTHNPALNVETSNTITVPELTLDCPAYNALNIIWLM